MLLLVSFWPSLEEASFHRAVAAQMQITLDRVAPDVEALKLETARLRALAYCRKRNWWRGKKRCET